MNASLRLALQRGDFRQLFFELMRFGGVGGLSTLIYFAGLWLAAKLFSLPMWLLAAFAYVPSLIVGYLLHRSFTFKSDKQHASAGPRFLAVQLAGMAFNSAAIWLGSDLIGWPFLPVQLGAMGLQVVLTYVGQKFFAFS